jgi:integrase
VEVFTFHNTRHSAATNLVNAGVSTNDAMEVTGHRTRSVFDRYKIAVKEQTRRSLGQVSEAVASHPGATTVTPLVRRGR